MQELSSDLEQFFLVKKALCIFKEQIWLPNKKCYGKYKILQTGHVIAHGVQIYKFEVDWMSSFQDMTYLLLNNRCLSKV